MKSWEVAIARALVLAAARAAVTSSRQAGQSWRYVKAWHESMLDRDEAYAFVLAAGGGVLLRSVLPNGVLAGVLADLLQQFMANQAARRNQRLHRRWLDDDERDDGWDDN